MHKRGSNFASTCRRVVHGGTRHTVVNSWDLGVHVSRLQAWCQLRVTTETRLCFASSADSGLRVRLEPLVVRAVVEYYVSGRESLTLWKDNVLYPPAVYKERESSSSYGGLEAL